jgi:hypothetical protein
MYCVKTGARVFIYELGAVVAADIYAVGPETLVIRWTPKSAEYMGPIKARSVGATHFVLEGVNQNDDWCREDICVMVTQRRFLEGELCDE